MIKKLNESDSLKFKTLNPEEKQKKGILGRLFGPVASFSSPTRNGRKYPQQLWEKLFQSDLMVERFKNGGVFGQLCHPDYEEVDMEKIACVMPEPPVRDDKGNLIAYVDILDTPCGKIAYQLAKYGYKFGISSRGTGDLINGPDGEEVDPETYQLNAFDLVEIPAVVNARLSFTESLDSKKYRNKTLRESLESEIDKADEDDRKIMEDSLNELFGFDFLKDQLKDYWSPEDIEIYKNTDWKARDYKDLPVPEDSFMGKVYAYDGDGPKGDVKFIKYIRANDNFPPYYAPEDKDSIDLLGPMFDGRKHNGYDVHDRFESEEVYNSLSESEDMDEANKIARNIKIIEDRESIEYKDYTIEKGIYGGNEYTVQYEGDDVFFKTVEEAKDFIDSVSGVNESRECNGENCSDKSEEVVNDKSKENQELVAEFQEALRRANKLEEDNLSLHEKLSVCNAKEVELKEELNKYKLAVANLSQSAKSAKTLKESLAKKDKLLESNKKRISCLVNSKRNGGSELNELKESTAELNQKVKELSESLAKQSEQLDKTTKLLNDYKKSYKALKESYLEVKAAGYGLSKKEVLQNLNESYKIKDIDSVCENLRKEKRNLSKLPFTLNENSTIRVNSNKEYINGRKDSSDDDFVSSSLLSLADIK